MLSIRSQIEITFNKIFKTIFLSPSLKPYLSNLGLASKTAGGGSFQPLPLRLEVSFFLFEKETDTARASSVCQPGGEENYGAQYRQQRAIHSWAKY